MRDDARIRQLLTDDRVILARNHPEALRCALKRAARAGSLARILPGVYTDPGAAGDLVTRCHAVAAWDPSAVICGRAAAQLGYWPQLSVGPIEVASPVEHVRQPGFRFTHRRIPPDLVMQRPGGLRITSPSLTAVELATFAFTDPIDRALRLRVATLGSLQQALDLTPHRRGHAERRKVLIDSRAEPWSAAERMAHRVYRAAGLSGWVTNHRVVVPGWATCYLDIAFRRQLVASEIDGQIHERDRTIFESDRARQNALLLEGWLILRFTWRMLTEDPEQVVATTRRALALRDPNGGLNHRRRRDTPVATR